MATVTGSCCADAAKLRVALRVHDDESVRRHAEDFVSNLSGTHTQLVTEGKFASAATLEEALQVAPRLAAAARAGDRDKVRLALAEIPAEPLTRAVQACDRPR